MPIYEYVCEKCGSHVEVLQKVGEAPLKRCQKCRGKLEKVVSRTSFQLKGSGWYATDYSSKKPSKEKSDTSSSESAAVPAGTEKAPSKKESGPPSKL